MPFTALPPSGGVVDGRLDAHVELARRDAVMAYVAPVPTDWLVRRLS